MVFNMEVTDGYQVDFADLQTQIMLAIQKTDCRHMDLSFRCGQGLCHRCPRSRDLFQHRQQKLSMLPCVRQESRLSGLEGC